MTFIKKLMDTFKLHNGDIEELKEYEFEDSFESSNSLEPEDSFELEIYDKIHKANSLAITVTNTTDSTEFYSSVNELKELLNELAIYEHDFDFSPAPSSSLKELECIEKNRIRFFEEGASESEKESCDMKADILPNVLEETDIIKKNNVFESETEKSYNMEIDTLPDISIKVDTVEESKQDILVKSEPYLSNRFVIPGLNYHFIDVAREVVSENRILKIPLMREYNLSESQLKEIVSNLKDAGIINSDNQVIIDKESLERFIDIYEPSLFVCENTIFDKEIFLCIGEIIYDDGIDKTYDSLPADELMEYLNIMEKLNIIRYDCEKNNYDILMTKKQYIEICKCIPSSFSSSKFDSSQNKFYDTDYDCMNGIEFENFCAYVLSENGFENIRSTPPSGDHGIDITAERKEISYAIQCKCYSDNIGNAAVQQAHTGKSLYHKDIAVVMTNRHFTPQAIEEAKALGVKLWDRGKLEEMIGNEREGGRK